MLAATYATHALAMMLPVCRNTIVQLVSTSASLQHGSSVTHEQAGAQGAATDRRRAASARHGHVYRAHSIHRPTGAARCIMESGCSQHRPRVAARHTNAGSVLLCSSNTSAGAHRIPHRIRASAGRCHCFSLAGVWGQAYGEERAPVRTGAHLPADRAADSLRGPRSGGDHPACAPASAPGRLCSHGASHGAVAAGGCSPRVAMKAHVLRSKWSGWKACAEQRTRYDTIATITPVHAAIATRLGSTSVIPGSPWSCGRTPGNSVSTA